MKAIDNKAWSSLAMLALVAVPLPYLLKFDRGHIATAVVLALVLCALALRSQRGALFAALAYLIVLGDYRRYAGYFEGYPASDPLLLVAPVCALVLCFIAAFEGRLRGGSALGTLVIALAVLMFAQIFNPGQGGVAVGLAGALFYIAPLLWFWIGRAHGSSELVLSVLRYLLVPLAVAAACLGIYQSVHGLLPFEAAWVKNANYGALYVTSDVVRAFGFSSSSAEYTRFVLVGSAVVVAGWFADRSKQIVFLPLFLVALLLASSRGPIVMFVLMAVVVWAVKGRHRLTWGPRFAVAAAIGVAVVAGALLSLQRFSLSSRLSALVTHQTEGLLNPTDTSKSTAVGHLWLALEGVVEGFTSFIGKGLGATTLAASKYGEGTFNAEMDFANMFYSLGAIGGVLYVAIMIAVVLRALSVWRLRRGAAELSLLAIIVATAAAWLNGGEYAIAALAWFSIGAVDRAGLEYRRASLLHARRARHT